MTVPTVQLAGRGFLAAAAAAGLVTACGRDTGPGPPTPRSGPWTDTGVQDKVQSLAPILAIDATLDPLVVIGRFEELATVAALPAARAGQFAPWRKLEDWSYPTYTADMEALLAAVRNANPNLAT